MEFLASCFLALVTLAITGASYGGLDFTRRERFTNPPICERFAVCADIFNQTRLMDDGSNQPELRVLVGCRCPHQPACALNPEVLDQQFIFRETTVHWQAICEPRDAIELCRPSQMAKEEHRVSTTIESLDGRPFIYHKINCKCPNNENPNSGFWNRATETARSIRDHDGNSIRYFRCKDY